MLENILAVILTLGAAAAAAPAGEQSASPQTRATLTAAPNPVPATPGMGTTTIAWDTGDGSWAQVFLSVAGGPEQLFVEGPRGAKNAPWISPRITYEFRLYAGRERRVLLAAVPVSQTMGEPASGGRQTPDQPPAPRAPGLRASLSASPNPLPAGSKRTTITWDTRDGSAGEVYVSAEGRAEELLSRGARRSVEIDWISPGNTYEFRLYAGAAHRQLLATVKVGHERAAPAVPLGFLLPHYLFIVALASAAYLVGRAVMPAIVYQGLAEEFSVSVGLGLGVVAFLVFLLGLAGLLYPTPMLLGLAILVAATYRVWPRFIRGVAASVSRGATFSAAVVHSPRRLAMGGVMAAATLAAIWYVPLFLMPLYPPVQHDVTMYHLPYAQHFVQNHRLAFLPTLQFPVFPQLNEMLFTLALLFPGEASAQLVQFLMMLTAAVAVYTWGARLGSRRTGLWAAALWLGNPLVLFLGTSAHVDAGLALFVTLSLYAFWRWHEARDELRWLVLAAVFGGFAAGTKYLALFFLLVLGATTIVAGVRQRRYRWPALFVLVAATVAAPWYVRNAYYTGNPVIPFFTEVFGSSEWAIERSYQPDSPVDDTSTSASVASGIGGVLLVPVRVFGTMIESLSPAALSRLLRLPYDLTFNRLVSYAPFSPIYFFLLPLLLFIGLRERPLRALMLFMGTYFWFVGSHLPDPRYFVVILPVLSVASAGVLDRVIRLRALSSRGARLALAVVGAVALSAPGWLYVADRIPRQGPVPVTEPQRDDYLAARLPSYPAYKLLNDARGDQYTVYALYDAPMAYFAKGRFLGWQFGPTRFARISGGGPAKGLGDAEELYRGLKAFGADYFLIANTSNKVDLPADDFFPKRFKPIYSTGRTRLFALIHD